LTPATLCWMGSQLPFPNFWPMSVVAKRLDGSRCHLIGRYRPRPRPHCVIVLDGDPAASSPLPQNVGYYSRPHFSAHVLWPNGCMDQDATWYGGRPRRWSHCVRWGPSSSPKGAHPQFSAHVCGGQTAGWIKKLPLDRELGLGPGHIVRWGPRSQLTPLPN